MNNTESRMKNSFRNTMFGFFGLLIYQIFNFATRSVFIRLLGAEYNGVNGLFSNILQLLNLAELGFATSVSYALYKPLKAGDEQTTAALMSFFAKVYRIIALVVTVAGCCCIPFLQYLIAEDISTLPFSLNELRGYFAMYLASTVCSYLLAYKRTIVSADQRNYLVTNVDNLCNILLSVAQIIMLLITKNFYAYLSTMIAKTVINNLVIHIISSKKYPYLRKYRKEKLSQQEKGAVFKNVQAAFLHRIGSVPFLIKNGINGLIYRYADEEGFFEQVKSLMIDTMKRKRLGKEAYNTIITEWNPENAAKKLLQLYYALQGVNGYEIPAEGVCSVAPIMK